MTDLTQIIQELVQPVKEELETSSPVGALVTGDVQEHWYGQHKTAAVRTGVAFRTGRSVPILNALIIEEVSTWLRMDHDFTIVFAGRRSKAGSEWLWKVPEIDAAGVV